MLPLMALSPFLLIPAAAWLGGRPARWSSLLAVWPGVLAVYFASLLRTVVDTGPVDAALPWAASLGLTLSFYADGLSLLFSLLITGIGTLIVVFGSHYLDGKPTTGRFQATLFAFMGSMLGVVLANSLLTMFVFWELTGFTSFLLIGFYQDRKEARDSAIQALVVTGAGGMALLAAAVLIEQQAGPVALSVLSAGGASLRDTAAYPAIAILVLLAAFTKSAQAPFHFWLPDAMTAPTPVSAYLHSATMVKAGVYLVARMSPVLGGTALWSGILTATGMITMMLGAWRALAETDLKRVLAYSTISALGVLMMLLGVGTETAVAAALVYLLAHACYKGTLFLVAGTLEHETGTRDLTELGGLRRTMPVLALAAGLAALSMAGFPLLLGFTGKELLYESLFHAGADWGGPILAAAIIASALLGVSGLAAGIAPFSGPLAKAIATRHVPFPLSASPLLLAAVGLLAGLWPGLLDPAIQAAAVSVLGTKSCHPRGNSAALSMARSNSKTHLAAHLWFFGAVQTTSACA
jgi:multicomponent Na+:H+ antiporter subunit A